MTENGKIIMNIYLTALHSVNNNYEQRTFNYKRNMVYLTALESIFAALWNQIKLNPLD